MEKTPERPELGEFLKACRARLSPAEVGLPERDGHRKVAGLRREEVASLAAISVDYYTRLEQGRVKASATVLSTLVRALRLDHDQQTYLYEIAGKVASMPRRRRAVQKVRPPVRRLLEQLGSTPAIVLGKRLHVLDWNASAAVLFTDFAAIPEPERNYVRLMFTHPAIRAMHLEWEHDARDAVAALRMEAGKDPDDPELAVLVGELSVRDVDFRSWWAEHRVNSASYGTKNYRHPVVGELTLDCDTWQSPDGNGQRLMILTAPAGTPSDDALRILSSWSAAQPDVSEPAPAQEDRA